MVGLVGLTVVATGVVLLPLPGPGMLVIIAGLAILASRFAWARRLLDRLRDGADEMIGRVGWMRRLRERFRRRGPGGADDTDHR